jgi:acyl dehydratase
MTNTRITSVEALAGHVGREINVGRWVLVTQEMVTAFAHATGDHYFIHTDPEAAKASKFGGTVAHGFFTLSMLAGFLVDDLPGVQLDLPEGTNLNYGLNRVRFIAPVPVGSRIRVRSVLKEASYHAQGHYAQIVREQTVEIEGAERPALIAETVTRRYFKPAN